jgi:hypothetical protein
MILGEGFKLVLSFRFDIHPRTHVIEESTQSGDPSKSLINRWAIKKFLK